MIFILQYSHNDGMSVSVWQSIYDAEWAIRNFVLGGCDDISPEEEKQILMLFQRGRWEEGVTIYKSVTGEDFEIIPTEPQDATEDDVREIRKRISRRLNKR